MSIKNDEDFAHVDMVTQDGQTRGSGSDHGKSPNVTDDTANSPTPKRGLQPPEFLVHLSTEERHQLEAKLKRKIDLRLMPAIILMYILNYIGPPPLLPLPQVFPGFQHIGVGCVGGYGPTYDTSLAPPRRTVFRPHSTTSRKFMVNIVRADRNNIAAAKLAGLQEELNLSSVEYETAVSILFVGYLLMQIPSNLLLNKFGKPAIYLPSCMIVWGIISAATAGCSSAGGLYAVRFFLGK